MTSRKTKAAEPKKDTANNQLGRTGNDRDHMAIFQGARGFSGTRTGLEWDKSLDALVVTNQHKRIGVVATYTSPAIKCKFPAIEFLPSWNVRLHHRAQGFRIYLRVTSADDKTSPWFFMGEGGAWDRKLTPKTEARGWGKTKIDYLALSRPAAAFQFKVEFIVNAKMKPDTPPAELHRVAVHYSGSGTRPTAKTPRRRRTKKIHIDVPYRSQLDVENEKLAHIVCCPTCVSMVMEHFGVDRSTLEVCDAAYDARYKIYGVWPRASQAAFHYGLPSRVDRFRSLDDVWDTLAEGQPIIASIRVNEGELRGARYPKSNGHLIVITGMKPGGKVIVNDPYSAGPGGAEIEYEADDIEKVWLDRGGVAVVIEGTK